MQWTFRNNTSFYISSGVIDMNLKNSWGNSIGTAAIVINSFKPYEARKVFGAASNVFAEDIYSWETLLPTHQGKLSRTPMIIQKTEGRDSLAEVNVFYTPKPQ